MQFRRVSKPSVGINIAPLVDVVFLLVIFFAVSTTFLETAGLELELPSSKATAKREAESLIVSLTQDGKIALGGESLSVEELEGRLRSELEGNGTRSVVLRATRVALVDHDQDQAHDQGDLLLAGNVGGRTWLKIVLTPLVPYLVSTVSSVAALREAETAP